MCIYSLRGKGGIDSKKSKIDHPTSNPETGVIFKSRKSRQFTGTLALSSYKVLLFRRRLPNTVCHDNQQSNLSLLRSDGAYSNLQPHKYGAEINR